MTAANRDAEAFFAWWNEHKHDGEWVPGGPVHLGHVQRAYLAGRERPEPSDTDEREWEYAVFNRENRLISERGWTGAECRHYAEPYLKKGFKVVRRRAAGRWEGIPDGA